mgnify:CR=1 FL=1
MKIKYRNGFPTKRSMRELINGFGDDDFMFLNFGHIWGSKRFNYSLLIWTSKPVQARMEEFIEYLKENDVKVGKYEPYESPRVGHLRILRDE